MRGSMVVAAMSGFLFVGTGIARAEVFKDVSAMLAECSSTSHVGLCEATRESFKSDWGAAQRGDYQAQRNVAVCLSTGCDGAIVVDRIAGCSWRMVIQGSDADLETTERWSYDDACNLPNAERRAALDAAEAMYRQIYRKKLPLKRLLK